MHEPADDRRTTVAALMAAEATSGEPTTTVALLRGLCRAAFRYTSAAGATVALMTEAGSAGVIASADEHSLSLDELQFTIGEGPSRDAFISRRPLLITDLASDGRAWPIYSSEAVGAGVRGVLAFPLHVGAAAFGVLTIYTHETTRLSSEQLNMLLTFAGVATDILLDGDPARPGGSLHPGVANALGYRAEIYQAQGVVMMQLGVPLAEALVRMRAHAYSHHQTLAELAALIMSGDIDLRSPDA